MESNKEYESDYGVALFSQEDNVDLSQDTFITQGRFVGDLGLARLFGDRGAFELRENERGFIFRKGKLENISAEEMETNALYELGVVLTGMRQQVSPLLCRVQLPDEQRTVITSIMEFDESDFVTDPLQRFYYNTNLWQFGVTSPEKFLLFDTGNEDLLRRLRFSFSVRGSIS